MRRCRVLGINPDGSASTVTYNAPVSGIAPAPPGVGSSVTTVDAKNHWKTVTSDVFGNVTQVTEPNPANAQQVSMPRNGYTQVRTMNYDATSFLLTSETHPETGTTQYF